MATVEVQVFNPATRKPLKDKLGEVILSTRQITDELPPDAIGEAVVEAVAKAWRCGNDPVTDQYVVVRFT